MYCPHCGTEVIQKAAFCPACGAKLSEQTHNKPAQDSAGSARRSKRSVAHISPRIFFSGVAIIAVLALAAIGFSLIFNVNGNEPATLSSPGEAAATDDSDDVGSSDSSAADVADGITASGEAKTIAVTSNCLGAWPASISNGEVELSNITIEQCDVSALPKSVRDAVDISRPSDTPRFVITADAENLTVDNVEIELNLGATYNSKDEYGDWQQENNPSLDLTSSWPETTEAYLAAREKREVVFFLAVSPDKHFVEINPDSTWYYSDPDSTWYYSDVIPLGISVKTSGEIMTQAQMDDSIELTGDHGVLTTTDGYTNVTSSVPSFRFTNTTDNGIVEETITYTYSYDGSMLPIKFDVWMHEALKPGESADSDTTLFDMNGDMSGNNYGDGTLELVPLYCQVVTDFDK